MGLVTGVSFSSIEYCKVCSVVIVAFLWCFFFFQAEDGIRDWSVTGVQTCALPICAADARRRLDREPTVVRDDDGVDDREPEPRASVVRRSRAVEPDEGLEDS